jgi:hypothetical protein
MAGANRGDNVIDWPDLLEKKVCGENPCKISAKGYPRQGTILYQ